MSGSIFTAFWEDCNQNSHLKFDFIFLSQLLSNVLSQNLSECEFTEGTSATAVLKLGFLNTWDYKRANSALHLSGRNNSHQCVMCDMCPI